MKEQKPIICYFGNVLLYMGLIIFIGWCWKY